MKKVFSLLTVTGFALMVSCGPSAEEKAAAEKARLDSLNQVQAQMTADSLARVEMEKARLDSIAMAMRLDSIAKAEASKMAAKPKPKPKTVTEKKIEEAKKVTGGRGK